MSLARAVFVGISSVANHRVQQLAQRRGLCLSSKNAREESEKVGSQATSGPYHEHREADSLGHAVNDYEYNIANEEEWQK